MQFCEFHSRKLQANRMKLQKNVHFFSANGRSSYLYRYFLCFSSQIFTQHRFHRYLPSLFRAAYTRYPNRLSFLFSSV